MENTVELPPLTVEFMATRAGNTFRSVGSALGELTVDQCLEIIRRSNQHEADQKRIGEAVEALEECQGYIWEAYVALEVGTSKNAFLKLHDKNRAILTKLKGER